jgi:hypothetical protein
MRAARAAGPIGVAQLILGIGLAGGLATLVRGQSTLEARYAAALVDPAQYIAVHSDQLYTHDGDDRYWAPEHDLARDNIQQLFEAYGLETTIEAFNYWGYWGYNVVGQHTGITRPDDIYIIGAHYDSISYDSLAPGADDNASGVAAVLEIARLVSEWPSEATVRFIAFDKEEWGLYGSVAYVISHYTESIRGMVCLDMLAYRLSPHNQAVVGGRAESADVKAALITALADCGGITATDIGQADYSDHVPFEEVGFHAAVLDEYDIFENDFIHTDLDSLETSNYIDYGYATALTRGALGWLVDAAGITPRDLPGDMNCDATVNTDDINPFVLAHLDPAAYAAENPDCHLSNADVNGDGTVDLGDVNPFVALFFAPCSAPQGSAKLWTADAPQDILGTSVALSGDAAAIGSNAENMGSLSGSVLICESSAGAWTEVARLTSPGGSPDDLFGRSVALDGTTLLVGAPGASACAGAAYVFERLDGLWTSTAALTAADGAADDDLGRAVAVSGETVLVGAPGVDGPGVQRGVVYVFERSGGVWNQTATLTASDGADYDMFGFSVAIAGNTAVVGAVYANAAHGAAYVFERSAGAWACVAQFTAPDGIPDDRFGYAVDVSGDTAVVAAYRLGAGVGRTMAYVYERAGGAWGSGARLGTWSATFGAAVAVDGPTILVGRDGGNLPADSGLAYVFQPVDGVWTQVNQLAAWDAATGERVGTAVALDGGRALLGVPLHFEPPAGVGAAYVFKVDGDGVPWVEQPPADQSATVGGAATMVVSAVAPTELSYRWRKDGQRLVDDGHISGADTATLTIDPVSTDDAGLYVVVVHSLCGTIMSEGATLTVQAPWRPSRGPAAASATPADECNGRPRCRP